MEISPDPAKELESFVAGGTHQNPLDRSKFPGRINPAALQRRKFVLVKLSYTVAIEQTMDQYLTDKDLVEHFYGGQLSHCASNEIDALKKWSDKQNENGRCLCSTTECQYLRQATPDDLERYPILNH